jgi:hypothetical protein
MATGDVIPERSLEESHALEGLRGRERKLAELVAVMASLIQRNDQVE